MSEVLIWAIGAPDGRSADLVDNYKTPDRSGTVTWRVGSAARQTWPLFHPSEADPEAGYRRYPYTVLFDLTDEPQGAYLLRLHYLVIAPRLASLELHVNGVSGRAFLRPAPSQSGEIRLLSGLHTTIYAEGVAEVVLPAHLLRVGENRLDLIARDDGEVLHVDRVEAIKRLDRMANGAGFLYQSLALVHLDAAPPPLHRFDVRPSVVYTRVADGTLRERCHVYLELGQSVPASRLTLTLQVGDAPQVETLAVPDTAFGHVRATFDLADGEGAVGYSLSGALGDTPVQASGAVRRRRKWRVYLTPHAHTDIGYTHRQWEVAERLCRNIDTALDLIGESLSPSLAAPSPSMGEGDEGWGSVPSFTYHLDSTWALETYLATRGEARRRQLAEAVRARRISLPVNHVDLLTHFAALEDLIRNHEFAADYLRPLGLRPQFMSVVDVASITSAMPALLEGSGVRYLVHANNQDRGPFRLNGGLHRVSPFYWQGVNGGRVLTWLAKMYCELRKVCGSPPLPTAAQRGLEMWLDEYERDDYAPDAVLLYGQEADNTDLDPQPVDFVRRWNASYAYPQLIPCDVTEFFAYVESHFGDHLVTVKGDSGAYWEDGALSSLAPTMAVRRAQAMLPAAERLEALAVVHTPDWAFPRATFDAAWRDLLLYDEHTWGAFLSCAEPDALLQHDQWQVKEGFARAAESGATRLLHAAVTRHSLNWNTDGREVVVYNPHSWTVSGPVQVEIFPWETVGDALTGEPVPTRPVMTLPTQAVVELWVDALPGLSYRRFVLRTGDGGQGAGVREQGLIVHRPSSIVNAEPSIVNLENDAHRLTVDTARGCVISWLDKRLGREMVDTADAWGFGALLYAEGGEGTRLMGNQADLPEGAPTVLADFALRDAAVERFAYGQRLTLRGAVPHGDLTVTWTLYDHDPRIDVVYTYDKEERRAKEAVYVAFPLALPDAAVLSDTQLGWVNWDTDELPGGCKEWLPLQSGILVQGGAAHVLIASPDIPLFCVGDIVRGRWPKAMPLRGGRVFSYVLNNYWHTNYKASQGGPLTFRYSLTSARRIDRADAFRRGVEARLGLYAQRLSFQDFRPTRAPYDQADAGTLARLDGATVSLSTLKAARWGEGLVARVQEIGGQATTARLTLPGRRIRQAWTTDLLERDLAELTVEGDGSLAIPVPAWGLATVRLVLA